MASRNFGNALFGAALASPVVHGAEPISSPAPEAAPAIDPMTALLELTNPEFAAARRAEAARVAAEEASRRPPPPPPPGGRVPPPPPPGREGFFPPPPPGREFFPPRDTGPAGPIERHQPYTQLAQAAINLLRGASREALVEATERARGKQIPADRLLDWIERKTRIGEVLGGPASGWSSDTINDFAQAFQMQPGNAPVMDALAALALLNWPDLQGELRQENTTAPTEGDLLQNRRVVYQYPAPGTPLEPPYVVLVAVEHQDMRRAEETVASILGSLVESGGFRMPREAAAKI